MKSQLHAKYQDDLASLELQAASNAKTFKNGYLNTPRDKRFRKKGDTLEEGI